MREADQIVAEDTRHTGRLLAHLQIKARLRSLNDHNERSVAPAIARDIAGGQNVALVSDAGTPLISDPGYLLVDAVLNAGARVVPIPGPSALVAALSASGIATDRFVFEGFLPPRRNARLDRLRALSTERRTVIFYEAPHRIAAALDDMVAVLGAARVAGIAKELTKLHEQVFRGTLDAAVAWLAADPQRGRGEFVIVLSGAPAGTGGVEREDIDRWLQALLGELPPARAARVLARITGEPRQMLYKRALALAGDEP